MINNKANVNLHLHAIEKYLWLWKVCPNKTATQVQQRDVTVLSQGSVKSLTGAQPALGPNFIIIWCPKVRTQNGLSPCDITDQVRFQTSPTGSLRSWRLVKNREGVNIGVHGSWQEGPAEGGLSALSLPSGNSCWISS